MRGHDLVILTERFPHSKDAVGLVFLVCFTFLLFRGLRDAKDWCTTLGHHVLVPALIGSTHRETPERACVVGSLASGQTGEFNDDMHFRSIHGFTSHKRTF